MNAMPLLDAQWPIFQAPQGPMPPMPIFQWDLTNAWKCAKPCRLCERNARRLENLKIHVRIRSWRDLRGQRFENPYYDIKRAA